MASRQFLEDLAIDSNFTQAWGLPTATALQVLFPRVVADVTLGAAA
jgi:hypothetical protein